MSHPQKKLSAVSYQFSARARVAAKGAEGFLALRLKATVNLRGPRIEIWAFWG